MILLNPTVNLVNWQVFNVIKCRPTQEVNGYKSAQSNKWGKHKYINKGISNGRLIVIFDNDGNTIISYVDGMRETLC